MAGAIFFRNVNSFLKFVQKNDKNKKGKDLNARRFVGNGGFNMPAVLHLDLAINGKKVVLKHAGRLELKLFEDIKNLGSAPLLLKLLALRTSNVLGIFFSDPRQTDNQLQTHAITFRVDPDDCSWTMQESHGKGPRVISDASVAGLKDYCYGRLYVFAAAEVDDDPSQVQTVKKRQEKAEEDELLLNSSNELISPRKSKQEEKDLIISTSEATQDDTLLRR